MTASVCSDFLVEEHAFDFGQILPQLEQLLGRPLPEDLAGLRVDRTIDEGAGLLVLLDLELGIRRQASPDQFLDRGFEDFDALIARELSGRIGRRRGRRRGLMTALDKAYLARIRCV